MASKSKSLSVAADIFNKDLEGAIRKISLGDIDPSADQPRANKDVNIKALAESLNEEGLLQPIVVTKKGNRYSIIAGERRYRAAKLNGWKEIECRVMHKDAKDKYRLAVIENIQRENLDAVEEAFAYSRLKKEFEYTDQQLSSILGKSRNYISEILSIAEIPEPWLQKAAELQINSKNLLVQFAQSVKIDRAGEFIESFKSGDLSTVKQAKEFIRREKNTEKSGNYDKNSTENTSKTTDLPKEQQPVEENYQVEISTTWQDESTITASLKIMNASGVEFSLGKLENEISDAVMQILKKI